MPSKKDDKVKDDKPKAAAKAEPKGHYDDVTGVQWRTQDDDHAARAEADTRGFDPDQVAPTSPQPAASPQMGEVVALIEEMLKDPHFDPEGRYRRRLAALTSLPTSDSGARLV